MVRRWKRSSIVGAGLVTLASVFGVSGVAFGSRAPRASQPVTITFDAMQYSAASNKYFPQVVDAFEKLHPNIKVNLRIINWSAGLQDINTEVGAGDAPSVAIIATRWLAEYANSSLLALQTSIEPKSFLNGFYSGALASIKYNGQLYSVPEASSVRMLIYNKTLFKKAGIATPPKTWTQLASDAIAIKKKTGVPGYALIGQQVETDLDYFYTLWGFGGNVYENSKGALTATPAVSALEFLRKLVVDGGTEPNPDAYTETELENMTSTGKIAMMVDGPWVPEAAAKGVDLGLADTPAQPGVQQRNAAITDSFVVFKGPYEKQAAIFERYMFNVPFRTHFDEVEGFLPVLKAVGAEKEFSSNPILSTYLKAFGGPTDAEPVNAVFSKLETAVTSAVASVYDGSSSATSALTTANAVANS